MTRQQSLAELAVYTLGEIQRMEDGLSVDQPERHVIYGLKRAAERAVEDALRLALELVQSTKAVRSAVEEIALDATSLANRDEQSAVKDNE